MNKLKNEARAIIENYDPKADFEETILKLASIGYKMEEAMMHTEKNKTTLFPIALGAGYQSMPSALCCSAQTGV